MEEPELDVDDIQGHVLVGFGGGYERLLGLRFREGRIGVARQALLPWVDRVTPARDSVRARAMRHQAGANLGPGPERDSLGVSLSLSSSGLAALGDFEGPTDTWFRRGAATAARALLDDHDTDGRPVGWKFGADEVSTPHVFVVLAGIDRSIPDSAGAQLLADLGGTVDVVYDENGRRLRNDAEHFGFADGISQPGPRGLVDGRPLTERMFPPSHAMAGEYARPGQPLVWPGQYIFGHATQEPDSAAPGLPSGGGERLLRNGSLLVFRRLRQDVAAFQEGMAALARDFTAAGLPVDEGTVAAWCMGRWPDGTPVSVSPDRADPDIAGSSVRRNGFLYRGAISPTELTAADGSRSSFPGAPNDRFGYSCPFFAHIRKVNPRDAIADQGGKGVTLRSQMLRRGVPYGPPWTGVEDGADRGLLFMSYQTSIENQFHRLMTLWVNSASAPPTPQGIDPVIGAPQAGRTLTRMKADLKSYRAVAGGRWVTTTGAGYFFAPGKSALREILAGPIV